VVAGTTGVTVFFKNNFPNSHKNDLIVSLINEDAVLVDSGADPCCQISVVLCNKDVSFCMFASIVSAYFCVTIIDSEVISPAAFRAAI
jgi:hypothetical protein